MKNEDKFNSIEEMSSFELSRWCALMEGVNIIADKCDDKKIDFNSIEVEPLSLRKYVEGTCDSICKQIEAEKKRAVSNNIAVITARQVYQAIFDDIPIDVNDVIDSRKKLSEVS